MTNVYFFTSNVGHNWDSTIRTPVDPKTLKAFLRPAEVAVIGQRSKGASLAWGAQKNNIVARMSVGDVIFGAQRGRVHFGAEIAFIVDRALPELSAHLWGRPDWPFIYFMGEALFQSRSSVDFLRDMGERAGTVWGLRRSLHASEKLARYSSKRDFITYALTDRPPLTKTGFPTRDSWRAQLRN